ncbi:hypothetical protein [Paenibacillus sp. YYML68]|uniref:hypothetical protein n=1 Tax=Paenibacillus sp. YYML68 TaxID=2909250 RepID=UPI00249135F2|nr:hypothetical protein [Paenibacillus sp. YYML68]
MEWNFLYRIDHLNERGEERNLKGLIFTESDDKPTAAQLQTALQEGGYPVQIEDADNLVFLDPNPDDPMRITIVKFTNEEEPIRDGALMKLAEQFRK